MARLLGFSMRRAGQKAGEQIGYLFRRLFHHEMAGRHGPSCDAVGPCTPDRERIAEL
jgi:hypothetical protein